MKRVKPCIIPQAFSLIELLIVIVIIGILTTIAYPTYTSYVLKSHRSDGLAALAQDQIMLERCYSQNFSYSAACNALPTFPQNSSQKYYSISLSNLGTSTYTLTAVPQGAQTNDKTCATMTVNQANVKTAADNNGNAQTSCWNPT